MLKLAHIVAQQASCFCMVFGSMRGGGRKFVSNFSAAEMTMIATRRLDGFMRVAFREADDGSECGRGKD